MTLAALCRAAATINIDAIRQRSRLAERRAKERRERRGRLQIAQEVAQIADPQWLEIRRALGVVIYARRVKHWLGVGRRIELLALRDGDWPQRHGHGWSSRHCALRQLLYRHGRPTRWARERTLPDGRIVWRAIDGPRNYQVDGWVGGTIADAVAVADREAAAAAAREAISRAAAPVVGARWEDDTLRGIRCYALLEDGTMVSPHRGDRWEGPALSAPQWSDAAALRREVGIHAAWPTHGGRLPDEVERARCRVGLADGLAPVAMVVADVAGYGRCVTGDLGWRAEHCLIRRVIAPTAAIRDVVARRYPEIDVVTAP